MYSESDIRRVLPPEASGAESQADRAFRCKVPAGTLEGTGFRIQRELGDKVGRFVGGKDGVPTEYAAPCGVCRQVMMEFCDPETFRIILAIDKEHYDIYTLKDLLPLGFGLRNLINSREI